MTPAETLLAVLLLLVTPGPTNTLLAVAGAERGWRGALRLIPAELGAYLAVTVPLATAGARLLGDAPGARAALAAAAGVWVAWLALAFWRRPGRGRPAPAVTARRVAVTTLLNPKALVFGLVLLPAAEPGRTAGQFAGFAACVVAVAAGWAALGAAARGAPAELPQGWRRLAAVWLGALAALLLLRATGFA